MIALDVAERCNLIPNGPALVCLVWKCVPHILGLQLHAGDVVGIIDAALVFKQADGV